MTYRHTLPAFFLFLLSSTAAEDDLLPFRIIGGKTVNIQNYPYQVSFELFHSHFCGGAIISKKYILSAGHCFRPLEEKPLLYRGLEVRVGASIALITGRNLKVKRVYLHPEYRMIFNDIAVVELEKPLVFSKSVQPIQLPKKGDELKTGDVVTVTGYGVTRKEGFKNILQMITVPVIEKKVCNQYYEGHIKEYMICAGFKEGGIDACQGDSGGPMTHKGKLLGIVSWGKGCAESEQPGVYTDVIYFLPYIKNVTGLS